LKEEGDILPWFDYIRRGHATCYNTITVDCSKEIHRHLGLDYDKTRRCVRDSFSNNNDWSTGNLKNTIIEAELKDWAMFG